MEPSPSERKAELSARIAAELGADAEQAELTRLASVLQNIGNLAIPEEVLLKQGELTVSERRLLERHAEIGCQILLRPHDFPEYVTSVALSVDRNGVGDPRAAGGNVGDPPVDNGPAVPESVAEMVLHHHERWDGKGYPTGLGGETIPIGARIIAVADTFANRVYRRRQPLMGA